jgi:nucleotide-binding universal stress UspA family protein
VITVVPSDDYFFQRIQLEEGSKGAQRQAEAAAHVNRLEGELRERGVAVDPQVIVSDKAEDEAIVEYVTQANCDLIVLPDQRRSLLSHWLKGNVAVKVQRRSPVPVLIVKDED